MTIIPSVPTPSEKELAVQTVTLLQKLVQNACVNDLTPDSGQEWRNADTLEEFFSDAPVRIERIEPHPGRVSLIVTVEGTDPRAEPLTLLGHTDVVPVDADEWTRDPFGAEIADASIWGRGTVDMLHMTAAMAVVTRAVALAGGLAGTLAFAAVADEEARGGLGAGWIAQHRPDAVSWRNCLSEYAGPHLRGRDGSDSVIVTVGEKGAAQRRLIVHGDAGHGSTPWGRVSTIDRIAEVVRRVSAIRPEASDAPSWRAFVSAFAFDASETARLEAGDFGVFGPLAAYAHAVSHLTIAQTVLRSGAAINVLPGEASLDLDIRTLPGQTDSDVDAILRAGLGDLADDVEIVHLISEPASASPTETRLFSVLTRTVREFYPDSAIVPALVAGGTDLRFARGLGGVGYGFGLYTPQRTLGDVLAQLHNHDEHMALADVELTVSALSRAVREFLTA